MPFFFAGRRGSPLSLPSHRHRRLHADASTILFSDYGLRPAAADAYSRHFHLIICR